MTKTPRSIFSLLVLRQKLRKDISKGVSMHRSFTKLKCRQDATLCYTERETLWDLRVLTTWTLRFCLPFITIKSAEINVFSFFSRMFYNNYIRKGMRTVTGFPGNALFSYSPVPHDWRQANLFFVSSLELFSGTHLFSLQAPLHVFFTPSSIFHLDWKGKNKIRKLEIKKNNYDSFWTLWKKDFAEWAQACTSLTLALLILSEMSYFWYWLICLTLVLQIFIRHQGGSFAKTHRLSD